MEKTIELRPEEQIRKIAGKIREVLRRERPDMSALTGLLIIIAVFEGSFWLALTAGIAFFILLYPYTLAPADYDPDTISDGSDFAEKGGES